MLQDGPAAEAAAYAAVTMELRRRGAELAARRSASRRAALSWLRTLPAPAAAAAVKEQLTVLQEALRALGGAARVASSGEGEAAAHAHASPASEAHHSGPGSGVGPHDQAGLALATQIRQPLSNGAPEHTVAAGGQCAGEPQGGPTRAAARGAALAAALGALRALSAMQAPLRLLAVPGLLGTVAGLRVHPVRSFVLLPVPSLATLRLFLPGLPRLAGASTSVSSIWSTEKIAHQQGITSCTGTPPYISSGFPFLEELRHLWCTERPSNLPAFAPWQERALAALAGDTLDGWRRTAAMHTAVLAVSAAAADPAAAAERSLQRGAALIAAAQPPPRTAAAGHPAAGDWPPKTAFAAAATPAVSSAAISLPPAARSAAAGPLALPSAASAARLAAGAEASTAPRSDSMERPMPETLTADRRHLEPELAAVGCPPALTHAAASDGQPTAPSRLNPAAPVAPSPGPAADAGASRLEHAASAAHASDSSPGAGAVGPPSLPMALGAAAEAMEGGAGGGAGEAEASSDSSDAWASSGGEEDADAESGAAAADEALDPLGVSQALICLAPLHVLVPHNPRTLVLVPASMPAVIARLAYSGQRMAVRLRAQAPRCRTCAGRRGGWRRAAWARCSASRSRPWLASRRAWLPQASRPPPSSAPPTFYLRLPSSVLITLLLATRNLRMCLCKVRVSCAAFSAIAFLFAYDG